MVAYEVVILTGYRTIMAVGVWDLCHEGHVALFKKARHIVGSEGRVIIVVNSDEFTEKYKGKPVWDEKQRLAAVRALDIADESFILGRFEDQMDLLDNFWPHLVIHGVDWTGEPLYRQFGVTAEWLERRGILFVYVDRHPGVSSTELRAKLQED